MNKLLRETLLSATKYDSLVINGATVLALETIAYRNPEDPQKIARNALNYIFKLLTEKEIDDEIFEEMEDD